MRIRTDVHALREHGIEPANLVVAMRLRGFRFGSALDAALHDAHHSLRYYIDQDGTVVVTTPRVMEERAMTRTYDVSDLVPEKPKAEVQHLVHEVSLLITETVEPASWVDAGGASGTITPQGTRLVVRNTPENLLLLDGLMVQLRQSSEPKRLLKLLREDQP